MQVGMEKDTEKGSEKGSKERVHLQPDQFTELITEQMVSC